MHFQTCGVDSVVFSVVADMPRKTKRQKAAAVMHRSRKVIFYMVI